MGWASEKAGCRTSTFKLLVDMIDIGLWYYSVVDAKYNLVWKTAYFTPYHDIFCSIQFSLFSVLDTI